MRLHFKKPDDSCLSGVVVDGLNLARAVEVKVSDDQVFGLDQWLRARNVLVELLAIKISDSVLNQVVPSAAAMKFVNRPSPGMRPYFVLRTLEVRRQDLPRVVLHLFIKTLVLFCDQFVSFAQHWVEWLSRSVLDSVQWRDQTD